MILKELDDRAKVVAVNYYNAKKQLEDAEKEMHDISVMMQTEVRVLERIKEMSKEAETNSVVVEDNTESAD